MELPENLQTMLKTAASRADHKKLMCAAQSISLRYRQGGAKGGRFIQSGEEALAYAVSRMPATYGAVCSSLKYMLESADLNIASLLDAGAGTGAATWAACELLDLDSIVCVEADAHMGDLGKTLASPLKNVEWKNLDITGPADLPQADLVVVSYTINEIDENLRIKTAEKLWSAAKKALLFVETGTPAGYGIISKTRSSLLAKGAHIIAPCPHEGICPIEKPDWCHFVCRIQRSRLHRLAKDGDAPFEDEKYSYLVLAKEPTGSIGSYARILRHPQIGKGHIKLDLCTKDGIKQATYSKSGGDIYKAAKKAGCGDRIEY